MDMDYESLLNQSMDAIPEVKLLPVGSYRIACSNASFQKPKKEESNPSVLFVYRVQEPMDDVDSDALAELGADYKFEENRIFVRFWVESPGDLDKVRKHIRLHGVDVEGLTLKEALNATKGREVVSYLQQKQFQNAAGITELENNATSFVALDA